MTRAFCAVLVGLLGWCSPCRALSAPVGVNLSWDDCGAAGNANKDHACDSNVGASSLVASVVLPNSVPASMVFRLDLTTSVPALLPSWWDFAAPAGCRQGFVSVDPYLAGASSCAHYWTPGASTSFNSFLISSAQRRINVLVQIPADSARSVEAGTEFYGARLQISHAKSTGADSCAGCTTPMLIAIQSATVYDYDGVTFHDITQASTRNFVTWQGSTVPTRRTSWGAIKGLYR